MLLEETLHVYNALEVYNALPRHGSVLTTSGCPEPALLQPKGGPKPLSNVKGWERSSVRRHVVSTGQSPGTPPHKAGTMAGRTLQTRESYREVSLLGLASRAQPSTNKTVQRQKQHCTGGTVESQQHPSSGGPEPCPRRQNQNSVPGGKTGSAPTTFPRDQLTAYYPRTRLPNHRYNKAYTPLPSLSSLTHILSSRSCPDQVPKSPLGTTTVHD
jgi:hypothetical protein